MHRVTILNGGKGYDDAIRRKMDQHSAKAEATLEELLSHHLYRERNAIEHIFCRLKDFRRIATFMEQALADKSSDIDEEVPLDALSRKLRVSKQMLEYRIKF